MNLLPEAAGPMWTFLAGRRLGTLATIKKDGRPQLSSVGFVYEPSTRTISASVTDGRAKTANLRRDARASLHASSDDGWTYVVAEGTADLTPVAQAPDDETVDELVRIYRLLAGEHPDWDEYRRAMVDEGRLVLRIHVERVYGMV
jgi:PPOX class probable F420-dependent enzyme